jgi:hypothetical protein
MSGVALRHARAKRPAKSGAHAWACVKGVLVMKVCRLRSSISG